VLSTKVNICEIQTSPSYQTASEKKKCPDLESKEESLCTFKELLRESSEEAGIINNA